MLMAILVIGFVLAVIDLLTGRRMSKMSGKDMFSVLVVLGVAMAFFAK
jgi:hypothetical protein